MIMVFHLYLIKALFVNNYHTAKSVFIFNIGQTICMSMRLVWLAQCLACFNVF